MNDERIMNKIMAEYEELRAFAADERKKRIDEVNERIPRVAEIDREIFQRGLRNTNNILKAPEKKDEYNSGFKKNLIRLTNEKNRLLTENRISPDYDKYIYKCSVCSDTGYTEDGEKCRCFKQRLINEAYSMSNMEKMIKKQNFETFSLDYYSKNISDNGISAYENMSKIYKKALDFCDSFQKESKGILFYGPAGLGKTFLSCAIAKRLMDEGKTVAYIRASKLFSVYGDYRYGRNKDRSVIDNIYSADLLIIDDLGTEMSNKANTSFLFEVINERIDLEKKIVINTNLNLRELAKEYSTRITSRLYESFNMYKFFGEDIRLKKFVSQ